MLCAKYRIGLFSQSAAVVVLTLFLMLVNGADTFAQEPYQRLVRRFETPELGITNPAGLAFSPGADALLVAGSSGTADLTILTMAANPSGSVSLATAIVDPLNMAFDGMAKVFLFYDADADELVEIQAGNDGKPKTAPEAITRFNAQPFGLLKKAQGMTFDPETGDLFFLVVPAPSAQPKIVRIIPDPQNRFNNPVVSKIDLKSLKKVQLGGIAFNPSDGHLYVMSPAEQKLHEVTQEGEVLTTRDLSPFELSYAQNMVFAPSGDQTDDPALMSLYIADSGLSSPAGQGDITELSLTRPEQLDLSAITVPASLVQTIQTSQWSPPSPDPAGAAYNSATGRLLISDSEVNEIPALYTGVNVFDATLQGNLTDTFATASFTNEPTGIAYNPGNGHLFFCDDDRDRVFEMDPGSDGLYGTSDDITTERFKTSDFGGTDPEGIAFDSWQGHLFIADGVNAEVYEVNPGANGFFDGVPPTGDDLVNQFDTSILGLQDPEGVEFNSETGNLYIVSNRNADGVVVETTTAGTAVSVIDISSLNVDKPGGLAYALTSVNPSERSLYIVARGVDNDNDPNENDGKVYEISLGSTQTVINVPSIYSTIVAALNAASNGDTILVAPGTYQEAIEMPNKSLVLASLFLITEDTSFISQTILDGNGGTRVIYVPDSVVTFPTIIGFTIQNSDDGIYSRAKFNTLNCYIINCTDGIDYESGSGGLCKFNVFENNSDDGIDLDGDVDIIIEDNIIHNNDDDGIEIRLHPYIGPLLTYVIRRNRIYGNHEDGIQLIDYNTLSDRFFLIERNLFYNNDKAGLGCLGDSMSHENYEGASIPERIYLFNNTFVGNNYGVTGGDSLVSVNNIFADHPGIAMKNIDGGSIVSYGIYWNNGTNFENSNVDNLNILLADPLLDAQYHLQSPSPAIDTGIALFFWQGDTVLNLPSGSYNGIAPDLGVFEFVSDPTNIVNPNLKIPHKFQLYQNYPNPFNPVTTIRFDIPAMGVGLVDIKLAIYNSLGQLIKTIYKDKLSPGSYEVQWDGRTDFGNNAPSGIYFAIFKADGYSQTRKLVLLK